MNDVPEAQPRLLLPNLQLVLGAWMERHKDASFPWEPPAKGEVEIGFSYPLELERCVCGHWRINHKKTTLKTGKIRRAECTECGDCPRYQELQFCGKMDLLPRSRENNRVHTPVDHKTTYDINATWARGWQIDSQMTGYVWAARHFCGEPVSTCYINAIGLREMPTSNRTCKDHGVEYAECGSHHLKFEIVGPIDRSDRQIQRWISDVQRAAAQYRKDLLIYRLGKHFAMPMEGTFTGACARCEFQEWCENEQPAKLEQLGYFNKPWSPIEHNLPGSTPKGSVFYIDNSTLRSINECTSKAIARYGWDWTRTEQAAPLRAGIAMHRGLEVYFKGASPQKALRALEAAYNEGKEGDE